MRILCCIWLDEAQDTAAERFDLVYAFQSGFAVSLPSDLDSVSLGDGFDREVTKLGSGAANVTAG